MLISAWDNGIHLSSDLITFKIYHSQKKNKTKKIISEFFATQAQSGWTLPGPSIFTNLGNFLLDIYVQRNCVENNSWHIRYARKSVGKPRFIKFECAYVRHENKPEPDDKMKYFAHFNSLCNVEKQLDKLTLTGQRQTFFVG